MGLMRSSGGTAALLHSAIQLLQVLELQLVQAVRSDAWDQVPVHRDAIARNSGLRRTVWPSLAAAEGLADRGKTGADPVDERAGRLHEHAVAACDDQAEHERAQRGEHGPAGSAIRKRISASTSAISALRWRCSRSIAARCAGVG